MFWAFMTVIIHPPRGEQLNLFHIVQVARGYLVPDLGATESAEDDVEPDIDMARISFRFKSKISMSDEDYAHTIHELETR